MLALLLNLRSTEKGFKAEATIPYVERSIELYKLYGKSAYVSKINALEIRLANLSGKHIGLCYPFQDKIELDRDFWITATDAEKEEVMLHELGHCVLDLDHSEPFSIMQATGTLFPLYTSLYQEFMDEYFDCSIMCPKVEWDGSKYD